MPNDDRDAGGAQARAHVDTSSHSTSGPADVATQVYEPGSSTTDDTRVTATPDSADSSTPPIDLVSDNRIGRYVALELLGTGGMGTVYRVYDPKLGREIALKLLRSDLDASDPDAEVRVVREAQAMAQLSHPNVLPVYDVEVLEDAVFITMEYVDGETMRSWLKTPRTTRQVLNVFRDAGLGLAAAHAVGIVHRDFKPGNVMVGRDGMVRVMDFGLARLTGDLEDSQQSWNDARARSTGERTADITQSVSRDMLGTQLTQVGAVVGTPPYMAPEQHDGVLPDVLSDQFSFCVALFEALYGLRPFSGRRVEDIEVAKKAGQIAERPKKHGVPQWIHDIVLRGLAPAPEHRWPSMEALLAKLADDPAKRRRRWLGMASLVAAASVATILVARERERAGAVCDEAASEMESAFDDTVASSMARSWGADQDDAVQATWARLRTDLASYAVDLSLESRDACEASHVRHEQSHEMLDLRMRCLAARKLEFSALIEALARPVHGVHDVDSAAADLAALSTCRDRDGLALEFAVGTDQGGDQIRKELAAARALERVGRFDDAMSAARRALVTSENAGADLLLARAKLTLSQLLARVDDTRQSARQAEDAYFLALRLGHDRLAVQSAAHLLRLFSSTPEGTASTLAWSEHAQALLARGRHPDATIAGVDLHFAIAAIRAGKDSAAAASLARVKQHAPKRRPEIQLRAELWSDILQSRVGDEPLTGLGEQAIANSSATMGARHPSTLSLNYELGVFLLDHYQLPKAIEHLQTAAVGLTHALGSEHPLAANAGVDFGRALRANGEWLRAREIIEAATRTLEQASASDGRRLARARRELGEIYLRVGEPQKALEVLELAHATDSTYRDTEPAPYATTSFALARALSNDATQDDRALALASSAREILSREQGRESAPVREIAVWMEKHTPRDDASRDNPADILPLREQR